MSECTLIIVDDDSDIRGALRVILEGSTVQIVAEADSGRSAIEQAEIFHPDCMALDISMPGMGGFAAARQILQRTPKTRIIFLTEHTDPAYAEEAFRSGASAFVAKRRAARDLLDAVEAVLSGRTFISREVRIPS